MFLFIFESIGTQELLLIGIVALIFLGPRRMPDIARKLGKMMADFRNATSEFKSTWEREVNFEEEERAVRTGELPPEPTAVARVNSILPSTNKDNATLPEVRSIDPAEFENRKQTETESQQELPLQPTQSKEVNDLTAKENWL